MSEILPFQANLVESPQNGVGQEKKPSSKVVLDKNGKPCKSCTAFRDLISVSKRTATSSQSQEQTLQQPPHCPPDVEVLGRATWTFLHSLAANYPEKPSRQQQREMSSFMNTLGRYYPCWHCADDFRAWMAKGNEPRTASRRDFEEWLCGAHNEVNKKLGKGLFDCSERSLNIRWRDGPSDGSCG